MKHLATLEIKNYTDNMMVQEYTHARALILKNGKYAMQRSRLGEYKLPGGRLEPGESSTHALIREVEEETGLLVVEESIKEIGEITEVRKDVFDENIKYICHSLYYSCEVREDRGVVNLTENEIEKGLELTWVTLDEAIKVNRSLGLEESRIRDTVFFEMIREDKI